MDTTLQPLLSPDPAQLSAASQEALERARLALDRFKALPDSTTFEEVVDGWDAIGRELNRVAGLAGLFFQVHPQEELRAVAAETDQHVSRFSSDLSLDREAYERLSRLDPDQARDPIAARIVEHALRDFRRAGVDREEAVRERVRRLREELVVIGQDFSRNIAADVRSISLSNPEADLDGLPDDWVQGHPPEPDGTVRVTTNPPDFLPFMKYARSSEHRQALYRVFHNRGTPRNLEVLQQMLEKRHELATLLGYAHWADYITEDKMIKSAENAAGFIGRVTELTGERLEREVTELLELLQEERPDAQEVRDWDRLYLMEQVRRRRYEFDSRDMRPFLPYGQVQQGVLDTAEALYGIRFERVDVPLWHPDVEAWNLLEDGQLRARFYLDMHPRPDKFKHAAMFDMISGIEGASVPEACLVCNFPRPRDGDPGLMEPGDVTTFFHEFGHLLHHLLAGRQRWMAVSGITTEWDFVEVPSQLFEEWARDASILRRFARHHVGGEPVPEEMVARRRAAQDYGKGIGTRVQMYYAGLSLAYYRGDPAGLDTTEVARRLKQDFVPFPFEDGTHFQAAFGHLEGYSALYYTYMWSLVLAKDLFSAFDGDLMSEEVARRYRDCVLAPGGSKDAERLVEDFLGRPFSFQAFEHWLAA
jgi:thimet oligopeptidase